jgi:hypothetical protein
MKLSGIFAALILLSGAAAFAADDSLPLGDGHISAAPQVGYLFSCQTQFNGRGAMHTGEWVQGDTWIPSRKPAVQGSVSWPGSAISIDLEGGKRVIRANDLPKHPTGIFPIQPSDPAYQFDRNPNSIQSQRILLTLPMEPTAAAVPTCVPMGMIGFALDGVAIFNAVDAAGHDAVAHEVQDQCDGHPQHEGQYHYHGPSPCMTDAAGAAGKHSDLVGYALDGYGIYGLHGEDGKVLHDSDLDACHGHTHAVMWDGKLTVIYHYHLTPEYPYTLGCFHGVVDASQFHTMAASDGAPPGPAGQDRHRGDSAALDRAAQTLGISADRLREALGPPPPDFAHAAQTLGISEQALRDAMRKAHDQGQGPP